MPINSRAIGIDSGSAVIDSRSVVIGSRSVVIGSRSVVIDSRSVVIDSRSVVIDSRSMVIDSRSMATDSRSMVTDFRSMVIDFESMGIDPGSLQMSVMAAQEPSERRETMKTKSSKNATAVAAPEDPVAIAAQIGALLDQVQALVPESDSPTPERLRQVHGNAKYGPELIPATTTAVTNYALLAEKNLFNVDKGRAALARRAAIGPIVQRMAAITASLAYGIDSAVTDSVLEAQQARDWANRHVSRGQGADLKPYADAMNRAVEKTQNKRPKKSSSPTPAPQGFLGGALAEKAEAADDDDDLVKFVTEELIEA